MAASLLIVAISLVLMAYWFRYTCILLLRGGTTGEEISSPAVEQQLAMALDGSGDSIYPALKKDYALVTYLLEHSAVGNANPLERYLLSWDYRIMEIVYRLTRTSSPEFAGTALSEMESIVRFFTRRLSQQAARTAA